MLKYHNTNRSSVLFKIIWAVFFGFNFVAQVYSQEVQETKINHYQARYRAGQWIMPGDTFVSNIFRIPIPDSVYTAGVITIKKYTSPTTKAQAILEFSHRLFQKTQYAIKRKHVAAFEQKVMLQLGISSFDAESLLAKNILLTQKTQGNKIHYIFETLPQ